MLLGLVCRIVVVENMSAETRHHEAELAQRFKSDGMLAYVDLVQRKEKEIGCDVLTHQKWYVFQSSRADLCVFDF